MSDMLRGFLDQLDKKIDIQPEITEPLVMEGDDCSVVKLAPAKGGLVGLDADTGRPLQVGWKYKTVAQKPVIINAGSKQTVIPPSQPTAPVQVAPPVTTVEAVALYNAMKARYQPAEYETENDVQARATFVAGCLADPRFYAKWQARLGVLEQGAAKAKVQPARADDWPPAPRNRQRVVDT